MLLTLFGARLLQLQGVDSQAYATRAAESGLVTLDLPAGNGQRSAGALAPDLLHGLEHRADGGHPLGPVPVPQRDGPA